MSSKVVDWETMLREREQCRRDRRVVCWTNGCFDLLHVGHVRNLQEARRIGDLLVVGLNSDTSVRALKGAGRPFILQEHRAEVLAALECVDRIVIFNELTPEVALSRLQPDVHCKGADYAPPNGKPIPEAGVVAAYGGRIAYLPMMPDTSTSEIVRRILGRDPS